jgi:hypothetical protein
VIFLVTISRASNTIHRSRKTKMKMAIDRDMDVLVCLTDPAICGMQCKASPHIKFEGSQEPRQHHSGVPGWATSKEPSATSYGDGIVRSLYLSHIISFFLITRCHFQSFFVEPTCVIALFLELHCRLLRQYISDEQGVVEL